MGFRPCTSVYFLVILYVIVYSNVVESSQLTNATKRSGVGRSSGTATTVLYKVIPIKNDSNIISPTNSSIETTANNENNNNNNSTIGQSDLSSNSVIKRFSNGAILRGFSVVMIVTGIVVVYFIIRAIRLRRKKSKTRKYGIIAKSGDLEMTPLDQDNDDDDTTVFEAQNHIRK